MLVLRALGLGDFLTALPALRAIRDALPGAGLTLAAPAWLGPLARMSGAVDAVLPVQGLAARLGRIRPEIAVNLHGRGPQSHRLLLATEPVRLVAFDHPDVPATRGAPLWRPDEHEVQRWCRLLVESGIPADPARLELTPPAGVPPPSAARGAVLLHPGAAFGARRWPARRWAEVARGAAAAGWRPAITAGPGEEPLAREVASAADLGEEAVLSGMDLDELAAAVAAAGCVCSSDTGVAHLATALRVPSVILFGPSPPAVWGPPPERAQHRVLWAGQTGDALAGEPDPGLCAITPDQVLEAAGEAMAADPRAGSRRT